MNKYKIQATNFRQSTIIVQILKQGSKQVGK